MGDNGNRFRQFSKDELKLLTIKPVQLRDWPDSEEAVRSAIQMKRNLRIELVEAQEQAGDES